MRNYQATAEAPGGSLQLFLFSAVDFEDALKSLKSRLNSRSSYFPFDHYRCSLVELPNDTTNLVRHLLPAQDWKPMDQAPSKNGTENSLGKLLVYPGGPYS